MNKITHLVRLPRPYLYRMYASWMKQPRVISTDDNSMYVAWHPKDDFPYECTKPLPKKVEKESTSVLRTEFTPELLTSLNAKKPEFARQELMRITHTTKHRWFPRARDKRAKKTPMDRQYL